MKQPIDYAGSYPSNWAGYVFREALGYTSGVHTGVDYNGAGAGNADLGMPIVAIASGRVVDRKMNGQIGGFGNCIIIETPNCPPNATGNKLFHRYLHMNSVDVNVGQEVQEGQRVGTVGNTGTQYAHLHLDVWTDRNGLGAHWNYDKDTQLASYEDAFRLIETNPHWSGATAPQLQPYQRVVGANGVNYRREPNTGAEIIQEFQPEEVLDFRGYVKGESYSGNNIWFVGRYTGGYCWSGAFKDTSTHDLPDLTAPVVNPPQPPVTPVPPKYEFTKDIDCVTEVKPAAIGNFEYNNFPSNPSKAVIHDFGTLGKDTFSGTVAWFQNPKSEVSAHFVISGKNIVQMVAIKDRAYHAGSAGNNFIGIETDPAQDPDTIASTRKVLEQLKAKYGYQLELIEHNQLMPTACGDDVDLKNYDITPVEPPKPTDPPTTPPEPEKPVEPPVEGSQTLWDVVKGWISKLIDWLSSWKRG